MASVDLDFGMQTVMSQQEAIGRGGIPGKAHPLRRVHQLSLRPVTLLDHQSAVHDGVSGGLLMAALIDWKVCVEKAPQPRRSRDRP